MISSDQSSLPRSSLTSERLQMFIAGLSGMLPEEVRKAKLLFLKNEIAQLRAIKTVQGGLRVAQGCFLVIPIFWPILYAQRSGMKAEQRLQVEQIRNALATWKEELGRDAVLLDMELEKVAES